MSAREAGYQLGYAAFPLILLAIGAFIGWRMGKRREPAGFVVWPLAVAAMLAAISMIGTLGMKMKSARSEAAISTSGQR